MFDLYFPAFVCHLKYTMCVKHALLKPCANYTLICVYFFFLVLHTNACPLI